jgi:hypothetical protein
MVMIVLNNRGYGAMKSFSRLLGTGEPPGIRLPGISYADVARGFCAPNVESRVRSPSLLRHPRCLSCPLFEVTRNGICSEFARSAEIALVV